MPNSLINFSSLVTDYGQKHFAKWLEYQNPDSGDLLFAVSSDGRSENILNALELGRALNMKLAFFSFIENETFIAADYSIFLNTDYYYIGETTLMLGLYGWVDALGGKHPLVSKKNDSQN